MLKLKKLDNHKNKTKKLQILTKNSWQATITSFLTLSLITAPILQHFEAESMKNRRSLLLVSSAQ
jgi:hypothetical protein